MNQHAGALDRPPEEGPAPTREEAVDALALLARFAAADPAAAAGLSPPPSRLYPHGFAVDAAYRAGLPDVQNAPAAAIRGAPRAIDLVGVSNVRLPVPFATPEGPMTLEARLTATVGVAPDVKGVSMSRLVRLFEARGAGPVSWSALERVCAAYLAEVGGPGARLALRTAMPLRQPSLRSGLSGWQYYDAAFEVSRGPAGGLHALHLDYVYASTCPCSLALAEHARATRGQLATPHSQRSVARLSVALAEGADLGVPDLVALMRGALPSETQAIVKREDEQAFAELNAANPVFVEDAARLAAGALAADPRAGDFRVAVSHQESLHSHDAVAVLLEGPTFASGSIDPWLMGTLPHGG